MRSTSKKMLKRQKFYIFYLFSLRITCVQNDFKPDVSQSFLAIPYRILDTEWMSSVLTDFFLLFTASL